MKVMFLVVVTVFAVGCSKAKKPSEAEGTAESSGATSPSPHGSKDGPRGPLSDDEKDTLRDCGAGALMDSGSSFTALDTYCDATSYLQVITSDKYEKIFDTIVFEEALWVVLQPKDGRVSLLRFVGGLAALDDLDEAPELPVTPGLVTMGSDNYQLVVENNKLWLTGIATTGPGGWVNLTKEGAGDSVMDRGNPRSMFRSRGHLWTPYSGSHRPGRVEPLEDAPRKALADLYKKVQTKDAHGDEDNLFFSVIRDSDKQAQLLEMNGETAATERSIDLPFPLDDIVVAHGFVWGVSNAEHQLVRVAVKGGKVEPIMTISKPVDSFYAQLAADDTSVWLSYEGDSFDSGIIRFNTKGTPTGYIGHLTESVHSFYPPVSGWQPTLD